MSLNIPLIGLLDDTLLPNEERRFTPPAVQEVTLKALSAGTEIVALSIASRVELPSLVTARWATRCVVVEVADGEVCLRGLERARLLGVTGRREPYDAEVEAEPDPEPQSSARAVALGAAQALMAVAWGATPDNPRGPDDLHALPTPQMRALLPQRALLRVMETPPSERLPRLASELAQHQDARAAAAELEAAFAELAESPTLDKATRHSLWSQVVAIQRRLDVYDPLTTDDSGDEVGMLQRQLSQVGLPRAARQSVQRELQLLHGTSRSHHDYTVHLRHLQFIARLPWHPDPAPDPSIDAVQRVLDAGHHGLEQPKRRILEYLAVRRLGGRATQTVLCLAGPPGTGKTSLARAVAEALGRPFVRVSLGGMHDEAELRGHRLSYVAAAPGRILDGVARGGSMNTVILLDELDKVGTRGNRSPVGALLEILDPEQNTSFRDNYLGFGFDLSHLLFICTANQLSPIPEPLRDRLEIIELDGYTIQQKLQIARDHLLPSLARDHGLPQPLTLTDDLLGDVIERHTREAGVRQLRRALASLHRDRALTLARTLDAPDPDATAAALAPLSAEDVAARLGAPRHRPPSRRDTLPAGVVTGLSVTGHVGGDLCFFEAAWLPGTQDDLLRMTGQLGDVMREASWNALALLRALHSADDPSLKLPDALTPRALHEGTFHLHVPEASTPKDGPSAGVAIFLAFLSAFSGRPLRADVALTGELNLSGEVTAVGGVRAKLLAAERAGIRAAFIPADNQRDVPDGLDLEVTPVRHLRDLLTAQHALFLKHDT